jgi:primosomal protein N' (replication factor Y)
VRFVATAADAEGAAEAAARVAAWLRRANAERLAGALTVLGPAPCPVSRIQGRWRWHVLAKAAAPKVLGRVVRAWRGRGRGLVVVDRDPVSLL